MGESEQGNAELRDPQEGDAGPELVRISDLLQRPAYWRLRACCSARSDVGIQEGHA